MVVRVRTRHSVGFNINSDSLDLALSPYAATIPGYVSRVRELYAELGISFAIWTYPADVCQKFLDSSKPIEYLLEVEEKRIVAYVDELSWSEYLYGKREIYSYSTKPTEYKVTSMLVEAPIAIGEVKARLHYRQKGSPDRYELIEEVNF